MEKINILICDDEKDIRSALGIYLAGEGYGIFEAENGQQALEIVKNENISLLLMDVMMPVMDGITALQILRKESNIPVILLTAKGQEIDKVGGLNAGADDYITKPYSPVEVIARVRSQIRRFKRFGGAENAVQNFSLYINGGIEYDDESKSTKVDGIPVNLTPIETKLLKFFMMNPDKVYSPRDIYRFVWENNPYGSENTVTVHIRHLREKIEINPANPDYIKSVFGHGYMMVKK